MVQQAKRGQLTARGFVVGVDDASNAKSSRDLDEHHRVLDIEQALGRGLADIEGETKDVDIGLSARGGPNRW